MSTRISRVTPLVVDPKALCAAGNAAAGIGDGLWANLTVVGTGFDANTGGDLAGVMFGRGYQTSAKSLLKAVAAAVNACRQVGALMQQGASNYSHIDAASTLGGGGVPLPAPSPPAAVTAPAPPKTTGPGEPPPLLWRIVQSLVRDVWPDGDVAGMRAAAGHWKDLGASLAGVQPTLNASKTLLDTQHIPEADQIDTALERIGNSTAILAGKCGELAKTLDDFAKAVDDAQRKIRDLLDQLSSLADIGHDIMLIIEGDALDEIEKIAADIDGVFTQLGREARAFEQGLKHLVEAADRAIVTCEKYARKGLIKIVGEEVGNPLATALNSIVDIQEVPLRSTINMGLNMVDLSPHWLLVDRQGLANTYEQLGETAWKGSLFNVAVNPREAGEAKLEELKGLVHAEDWGGDRPALGPAETAFDIGTSVAPVVAELRGAGAAGRGAQSEAGAAAGKESGEAAGGIAGTRAALGGITKVGEALTEELENSTEDLPKIQPPSSGQPVNLPSPEPMEPPVGSAPKPPDAAPGVPQGSAPPTAALPDAPAPPATPPRGDAPAAPAGGGPHGPVPPGGSGVPGGPHGPVPSGGSGLTSKVPDGPHDPVPPAAPAPAASATPGGPHDPGSGLPGRPVEPPPGGPHEPSAGAPGEPPAEPGPSVPPADGGPHDPLSNPAENPRELVPAGAPVGTPSPLAAAEGVPRGVPHLPDPPVAPVQGSPSGSPINSPQLSAQGTRQAPRAAPTPSAAAPHFTSPSAHAPELPSSGGGRAPGSGDGGGPPGGSGRGPGTGDGGPPDGDPKGKAHDGGANGDKPDGRDEEDPNHRHEGSIGELSAEKRDEIIAMPKGTRPDPSDYLSAEYIARHLSKFNDGATRFMPESNLAKYGIAQRDGTSFVMPRHEADAMLDSAEGNLRTIENELGLPEGFLDSNKIVRIDIPHPEEFRLRIPSGNEAGANEQWIPGGLLPDGASEAVIDGVEVPPGGFTVTDIE